MALIRFRGRLLIAATALFIFHGSLSSPAIGQADMLRQFSIKAGEIASQASLSISENKHQDAIGMLDTALNLKDLSEYEKSSLLQMRGSAYYAMEKFDLAIASFDAAIKANGLTPDENSRLDLAIAQLVIGQGHYASGAQRLEAAIRITGREDPKLWGMLAQSWAQAENYEKALPWARKWAAAAPEIEREHFDFLNYLYHRLGRAEDQLSIVKQMMGRWPDDDGLWRAYISLLSGQGLELEAFNANKVLYVKGALDSETELLRLVQYHSYFGLPYQAAEILAHEIETGRISDTVRHRIALANHLRHAREYDRAIPVLEAAVNLGGPTFVQVYPALFEAYVSQGSCSKARDLIEETGVAGYDPGKAWMLVGTCIYERAQNEERPSCDQSDQEQSDLPIALARTDAIRSFSNAPLGSSERQSAQRWISFIRAERRAERDRCAIEKEIEFDRCRLWYQRAKKTAVVTGKPVPENSVCAPHIAAIEQMTKHPKSPS